MFLEPRQLQVNFPYTQGMIPAYANAALVNLTPDGGLIIDFGFIDPLLIHSIQNQVQTETDRDNITDLSIVAQPVERIFINLNVAEQLARQLQRVLEAVKTPDVTEKQVDKQS